VQTATGDPLVGRVLEGRYRIVGRIARGGMSTVYRAVDDRLDREVAVKVMSSSLSTDPAFADRFAREARIAARLAHTNAVAVFDQGADAGHVFLVMELVSGRTLRDLLREGGALEPALAVSIMEPVLGALAAAHRAGLVHRDVKPENILLSDDGVVKVADFGLARAVEADASSTRTGLMMGTVAYCPPEQLTRGSADTRSDVYAAGVVLFELLTGSAPFNGDNAMAVAYQHVNSDMPPPSSRRGGIPPALDDIVQRATNRDPAGRPLDAGAMLAELHDVRMDLGLPVVAVPLRRPARLDPDATQVIPATGAGFATRAGAGRGDPRRPARPSPDPVTGPIGPATVATSPTLAAMRPSDTRVSNHAGQTTGAPHVGGSGRADVSQARRQAIAARRRRSRRRTILVIVLVLVLGLLTGYGAWWFTVGRYRDVPNVSGMSQTAATTALRQQGFTVAASVEQQYSETVPVGTIIATDPRAGRHLLQGKQIALVLSRGPERFTIPAVTGKTYDQASAAFAALPLRLVQSDAPDGTGKITKGLVMRTDPGAGSEVRRGQIVTVYVSSGPPVITVPDVTGQSFGDANQALSAAGFSVSKAQDYSTSVPQGAVISTSPAGGSNAVKFTTVTATVSQGQPFVTIPDIQAGDDPNSARDALQALGLQVTIDKKHKSFFDFSGYVVDSVDPQPGTQVRRGSTVTLHLK
jgi:serine/threonine-protein kinase